MKLIIKIQLVGLFLLFSTGSWSQNGTGKGSFFSVSGKAGPTGLKYDLNGPATPGTAQLKIGYGIDLKYTYYFNDYVGLGTGIGMQYFNSSGKWKDNFGSGYYNLGNRIDDDIISGKPREYEMRVRIANWEEEQTGYMLNIPVMVMFQRFWGESGFGMFGGVGAKYQLPVNFQYKIQNAELNVSGYYPDPGTDIGAPGSPAVPQHGFGTRPDYHTKENIRLKSEIAGTLSLGVLYKLGENTDLCIGAFLDYGLNDISKKEGEIFYTDEADELRYRGALNSTSVGKINALSYGGEIGIRFRIGRKPTVRRTPASSGGYNKEYGSSASSQATDRNKQIQEEEEYNGSKPEVSYIVPVVERVKRREIVGKAHVMFEIGQTNLIQNLGDNRNELKKIRNSIDFANKEPDVRITGITLIGWASPDNYIGNNERLSEGRAITIKNYLKETYNFPENIFAIRFGGENWMGLADSLQYTSLTEKEKADIINIIQIQDLATRKTELKKYQRGIPYQYLLEEVFPQLRRTDYKIEYTAPAFSVEKGRELIDTKPEMLSLNEMYIIANSYQKGSVEFNRVFETASRLYPNDVIANINSAAVALEKGELTKAAAHLEKCEFDPKAYNNLGVLFLLQKEYDKAEVYLKFARENGSKEAVKNLKILYSVR